MYAGSLTIRRTRKNTMQITSRFTIAVHIITATDYFSGSETVTSNFLAGSIGANPVIVRGVMGDLKEAGIISISQGKSGITLSRPLEEITFFDLCQALDCIGGEGLFHFHERPNEKCPVGRHIHAAVDEKLRRVQTAMEEEMKKITLADVAEALRQEMHREK